VTDHALAAELATEAGRLLLRLRDERGFADPTALKDAGDKESHDFLMAALAEHRPGDAVLSEEGKDDPVRLGADRVWIVDPLDGTREFGEEGRTDWAVHVALWEREELSGGAERGTLTAGAVSLPARDKTLATTADGAALFPGDLALRLKGRASTPVRVAVSRSRPPGFLADLAAHVDLEFVPIGSAGAKIAAVVLGEVDAYIHAGGQYEWDSAAPAAVALAAGAHASRIDGDPLAYNRKDPRLPDILVCHPMLASTLLAGIRTVTEARHPDAERNSDHAAQ
jgi:3'(2'), 5'-bisphosphate nucleotidase